MRPLRPLEYFGGLPQVISSLVLAAAPRAVRQTKAVDMGGVLHAHFRKFLVLMIRLAAPPFRVLLQVFVDPGRLGGSG